MSGGFLGKVRRRLNGTPSGYLPGVPVLGLDRPLGRTNHDDAMHRILGVLHANGLLWHEETVSYRHGATEVHRVTDARPAGSTNDRNAEDAGRSAVIETPQYYKYGLYINPRILPRLKGMGPQFAYALNVSHVSVEVDGNIVYVRVPREDAGDTILTSEAAWAMDTEWPPYHLLLGQMEDGTQARINAEINTHIGVIGMTRSGKSSLMKTMALGAEMVGGCKVVLCDPTGKGFWFLSGHSAVEFHGMFKSIADIGECLRILANRVCSSQPQAVGLAGRVTTPARQPTFIFVDEVPLLVKQDKRIADYLGVIAASGRQADMHLILGAQYALAEALGKATIKNIVATLVGKVRSAQEAYNVTGQAGTGAEKLRGNGDFIAVTGAGLAHFQAAIPSDRGVNRAMGRDEDGIVEQWMQRYPPQYGVLPAMPQNEMPANFVLRPPSGSRPPEPPQRAMQVTAPIRAMAPLPDSVTVIGGDAGRPEEDPSPRAIWWVSEQWVKRGKPPALSAIYNATKTWYPRKGGYGRPKAARAIEAAVRKLPAEMQGDAARVAAEIVARYSQ